MYLWWSHQAVMKNSHSLLLWVKINEKGVGENGVVGVRSRKNKIRKKVRIDISANPLLLKNSKLAMKSCDDSNCLFAARNRMITSRQLWSGIAAA